MIEGIGGKRVKIPLCKITLKSQWKNGPIQVGVVDKLPMKGISLILGNEIKTKKCHPCKMEKISTKNEERKMARMNAKHGKKMAKMNAKNGESKLAKMNAKNGERKMAKRSAKNEGDKMAAEPRARYKRHSRSQSEKMERKEVKLPHLREQKEKGTSLRRRDKTPKNNGNKFPEIYREDKRKMRGPSQVTKKEGFEKGDEVLLLSSNKEIWDGRERGSSTSDDEEKRKSNFSPQGWTIKILKSSKYDKERNRNLPLQGWNMRRPKTSGEKNKERKTILKKRRGREREKDRERKLSSFMVKIRKDEKRKRKKKIRQSVTKKGE